MNCIVLLTVSSSPFGIISRFDSLVTTLKEADNATLGTLPVWDDALDLSDWLLFMGLLLRL